MPSLKRDRCEGFPRLGHTATLPTGRSRRHRLVADEHLRDLVRAIEDVHGDLMLLAPPEPVRQRGARA